MPADPTGPFVALAVLCDRIEPKPDGTVDVYGIVDGVVLTPEGDDALGLRPAATLSLTAVVSLKAGDRRGTHRISLQGVYPSQAACPRCGGDLSAEGAWLTRPELALVCGGCASAPGPDLSPAALGFLRGAAGVPPGRLGELPLARATGREIEAVHRALIRAHLEREPRSNRVLRELGAT